MWRESAGLRGPSTASRRLDVLIVEAAIHLLIIVVVRNIISIPVSHSFTWNLRCRSHESLSVDCLISDDDRIEFLGRLRVAANHCEAPFIARLHFIKVDMITLRLAHLLLFVVVDLVCVVGKVIASDDGSLRLSLGYKCARLEIDNLLLCRTVILRILLGLHVTDSRNFIVVVIGEPSDGFFKVLFCIALLLR